MEKEIPIDEALLKTILKSLVSKKTVNPPGDESLAAGYIAGLFRQWRTPYKRLEKSRSRANVVATIGKGKPVIVIVGHTDVVPPGEGWKGDPFTLKESKGVFTGRGVVDDKGPLTAVLLAAKHLKRHEKDLRCTVKIVAAADEERGSEYGALFLLKGGLKADYAIIPDICGSLKTLDIAEKGRIEVQVAAHGKQGHGAYPESGLNAIDLLAAFLVKLKGHRFAHKKHPYLSAPTCNTGNIAGGSASNMIPATASAVLDIRFLPGMKPKTIVEELQALADTVPHGSFTFETLSIAPPTQVAARNSLVKALQEATKEVTGKVPVPVGSNGATIAKQFIAEGIPAVGIGIGDQDQMHAPNESIKKKEIVDLARVLVLAVEKFSKS